MFKFLKKKNNKTINFASRGYVKSKKIDFDFKDFSSKNIFNKLSDNSEYGFYYFPYGYLYRYPKWGTINELGFRNKESLHKIREKFENEIIILVFGNSCAFSILVKDEDTFCSKLENKLNDNNELIKKLGKKFKVINMGQNANVMMKQIIHFLCFGHQIKPEIVISHSGAGDFHHGQFSDSFLLNNYSLTYHDVHEAWAKKIHDSEYDVDYDFKDETQSNFKPVIPKNNPEIVMKSYHDRVLQFKKIVESYNSKFICGFHPWIYSKKNPSEFEKEKIQGYFKFYKNVYDNIFELCEKYQQSFILNKKNDFIIDIHEKFKNLDPNISHFGDVVHTLEPGDEVISKCYYDKILNIYK
tara:strand:+ start:140 stop:1204 length:1065 start_codon:yes stop_codon:yes gene_type:complete